MKLLYYWCELTCIKYFIYFNTQPTLPLAVLSVPPINRDAVAQQLINRRGKVVENYDEDTLVRLQFVACYVVLYISICVDDVIEISFCLIREKASIYIV